MGIIRDKSCGQDYVLSPFLADVNFIAHWANLGCLEESPIRNHILQSLISHPTLYSHQANALISLFKFAGATFEKYAGPSVVDRCFELHKSYYICSPMMDLLCRYVWYRVMDGCNQANMNFRS